MTGGAGCLHPILSLTFFSTFSQSVAFRPHVKEHRFAYNQKPLLTPAVGDKTIQRHKKRNVDNINRGPLKVVFVHRLFDFKLFSSYHLESSEDLYRCFCCLLIIRCNQKQCSVALIM